MFSPLWAPSPAPCFSGPRPTPGTEAASTCRQLSNSRWITSATDGTSSICPTPVPAYIAIAATLPEQSVVGGCADQRCTDQLRPPYVASATGPATSVAASTAQLSTRCGASGQSTPKA